MPVIPDAPPAPDVKEEASAAAEEDDFAAAAANVANNAEGEEKDMEGRMSTATPMIEGGDQTIEEDLQRSDSRREQSDDTQPVVMETELTSDQQEPISEATENASAVGMEDVSQIESKQDDGGEGLMDSTSAQENAAAVAGSDTAAATTTCAAGPPTVIGKRLIMCGEDMPNLPDNTEDVDEPQQNEHFETRQSFLNLCQGNNYQFDMLRRAKHSSMMVLYHLHNPDAPKFVPTCSCCKQSIASQAWHCRSCDIDFCTDCLHRYGPRVHVHPLQQTGSAPQMITEEQRKERERSIKLHMQLLNHAANCPKCESKNCARMKVCSLFY